MINRYVLVAIILAVLSVGSYVFWFAYRLNLGFAQDPAVWGTFGDYVGGTVNPVLSFLSLILLIRSVTLQNDANHDLRKELKENEKTEQIKAVTTLFFSMINSQREMFSSFKISTNGADKNMYATAAVIHLENKVEELREANEGDDKVSAYLEEEDVNEQIFGILRSFYITVQVICERLSDERGFDKIIRREFLRTLINFTEFAQLRLVVMAMQFTAYPASNYLRSNADFLAVMDDVGFSLAPY